MKMRGRQKGRTLPEYKNAAMEVEQNIKWFLSKQKQYFISVQNQ
jgi:hypothetical protein